MPTFNLFFFLVFSFLSHSILVEQTLKKLPPPPTGPPRLTDGQPGEAEGYEDQSGSGGQENAQRARAGGTHQETQQ